MKLLFECDGGVVNLSLGHKHSHSKSQNAKTSVKLVKCELSDRIHRQQKMKTRFQVIDECLYLSQILKIPRFDQHLCL